MSDDNQNKTEEPTQKRLQEAHEKGQFARTEDLGVVFVLMATFVIFVFIAKDKARELADWVINLWSHLHEWTLTNTEAIKWVQTGVQLLLSQLFSLFLACTGAAILAGGIQSGFRLTYKTLAPNWEKVNPVNGLQRLFSFAKCMEVLFDGLKFTVMGFIIYDAFKRIYNDPIFYSPVPFQRIPELFLNVTLTMLSRLIFTLGFLAGLKYLYERYNTHKKLMMSREEVKEELRQTLGNPEIKMAQRRMALRLLQKQMLHAIPTADVVITNPTHYAVVLKYERGKDKAPVVLAKGENLFAQRIKDIAKNFSVPTVENRLAARILFRLGKVGKPIPVEVYELVAEILAYVYRTHKYYFYELKKRRNQIQDEPKNLS